ncbi:MAG: nucleotidyl transferase AbiEii/AbiGii toxin family protein [Anaerolineales bacterium]
MRDRQITNLPASVLQRLRNESRKRNQIFQEILTYFGLERFLYRLSKSDYCERFVLKGALVMMTWPTRILRTTRDLDFRAYIRSDQEEVSRIIREICTVDIEPDAIRFDVDSVKTEIIIERAKYPGVRVYLIGYIEAVKIPLQIDLGFSDEINPPPMVVNFPTILDFPNPVVYAYQPETVLSEKVEAIYCLGDLNTRMNDFYDIWVISNEFQIDGSSLLEAMSTTFMTRGTRFEVGLSTLFSEEFIGSKSDLWKAFLAGIGKQEIVSTNFESILVRIEEFIQPIMDVLTNDGNLDKKWDPKKGWRERC